MGAIDGVLGGGGARGDEGDAALVTFHNRLQDRCLCFASLFRKLDPLNF
ncbi:hypothetical protein NIES2100_79980 (plasmid) [Calothrix sp. NIES-2100]|nr:hypothetical protein NIES2100_79980 [Calothrix sp. NIES-2100]